MRGNFVAYYRVSTDRQGRSGLGLDAQQKAVQDYLNGGDWSLVAELTEVETGKRSDRPELAKALALCRKHKGKLVIRGRVLGRNAAENLAPRYRQEALARAIQLAPVLRELADRGFSARAIARTLTDRKIGTPKGGAWHAASIRRMLQRIEIGCGRVAS
jgi:hypothetical protein